MPYIDVNGESIYYERAGNGPALLLIHSLGTASWLWRTQMDHWSTRYSVIAPDARGHGASSNRGGFSIANVAQDLLHLLRALGTGPAHVIGISMGGPIAVHLVHLDPSLFSSLVIADSFATQGTAGATRAASIEAAIHAGSMAAYGAHYARDTLGPASYPGYFDTLSQSIARMSKSDYIEAAHAVFTADSTALMRGLRLPTCVVVGADDQRTPPSLSQHIATLIPGAQLHMIEGAKHLANLDQPDRFNEIIDRFLKNEV